jgi:hypothetical protein
MKNKSQYSCMYLVPPEIYSRLLDSADAREKIKVQELNATEVGNENGAFPNLPDTPDHDANTSQDDNGDDDYGGDDGGDDGGRYDPPPPRHSTSSSSRQSSHGSTTDTASETENYLQNNPNYQNAVLSNRQQRFLQQYSDSEDDSPFSSNFAQHPQLLRYSLDPVITPQLLQSPSSKNLFSSNFAQHPQSFSPSIEPSQNRVLENNIGPELERIMNDMIKIRSAALEQQRVLRDINKKAQSLKTNKKSKTNNIIQAIEHISRPVVNTVNNQQQTTLKAIEYIPQQPENQTNPLNSQTITSQTQPFIPQQGTSTTQPLIPQPGTRTTQPFIPQPGTSTTQDSNITQSSGAIRKSYPCDICKIIFITNKLLIQHKKDFHSSQTAEKAKKNNYISWKNDKNQKRSKLFEKKRNEWKKLKKEISSKKKKNLQVISLKDGDISMEDNIENSNSNVSMTDSIVVPNLNSFSMESISVLQCKLCPATFNTQKGLERHIKNIHETDANYNPKNKQGIKRKIENTNGNIIEKSTNKKKQATHFYKCKLCSASFKEKKTHDRHLKNIHSTNEDYKYNLQQGKKRKRQSDTPKKESRLINSRNQNYKKWK